MTTMTTEITHDDRIFDHLLISEGGLAYAETIVGYKERLGITVLRRPAPGTELDMCIVYKPDYDEGGQIAGYHPVEMSNAAAALMGAMAKGFLLTPLDSQDEPEAVPAEVEDTVESQTAQPEEQPSPDTAASVGQEVPPLPGDTSSPAIADAATKNQFVCDRKYANNRQCSKTYKSERHYLRHIRDKHAK